MRAWTSCPASCGACGGSEDPAHRLELAQLPRPTPLFGGVAPGSFVYFVHSYVAVPQEEAVVAATCSYGEEFTAAVRRGNVWGTQFHPEKSSQVGLAVLRNFVSEVRACS